MQRLGQANGESPLFKSRCIEVRNSDTDSLIVLVNKVRRLFSISHQQILGSPHYTLLTTDSEALLTRSMSTRDKARLHKPRLERRFLDDTTSTKEKTNPVVDLLSLSFCCLMMLPTRCPHTVRITCSLSPHQSRS